MDLETALFTLPVLATSLLLTGCPSDDGGGASEDSASSETGDGDGDPAGDGDGDDSSGESDSVGDGDGDDPSGDGDGDGDDPSGDGDGDGASCGDGVVEGVEACDDGNPDNSDGCLDTCELASCGDGFVWTDNEDCDDANPDNTDECLDSCALASCGDGFVWADNEECDPADPDSGEGCDEENCMISGVFFEDFEGDVDAWTHEAEGVQDTWNVSQDQVVSGMNSYHSGVAQDAPGSLRLISPSIDLTTFTDLDTISLGFQQWYSYDICDDPGFIADGHLLEISVDDGPYTQVNPDGGYPYVLQDICENPLVGTEVWSQSSNDMFEAVTADLSAYVGSTIKLAWTIGLDCGNCDLTPMLYLDDVSVTRSQN